MTQSLSSQVKLLRDALENAVEHIAGEVDVIDGDYGFPKPNKAMILTTEIERVLNASESLAGKVAELEKATAIPVANGAAMIPQPNAQKEG